MHILALELLTGTLTQKFNGKQRNKNNQKLIATQSEIIDFRRRIESNGMQTQPQRNITETFQLRRITYRECFSGKKHIREKKRNERNTKDFVRCQ